MADEKIATPVPRGCACAVVADDIDFAPNASGGVDILHPKGTVVVVRDGIVVIEPSPDPVA